MKKKTATAPIHLLKPEIFIQTKSKKLPLGDCFINDCWKKNQSCLIFVTRKHVNGNVTLCSYAVDLKCLGIKFSAFRVNISAQKFDVIMKEQTGCGLDYIKIPYELAHNIIYSGVEFAKKNGFNPYSEFNSVTRYFLEDTEDIPLIEIECGKEGKPYYYNVGAESPKREKEIVAQLEKTVGEGNYYYNPAIPKDCLDEDKKNEFIAEITQMGKEGRKKLYIEFIKTPRDKRKEKFGEKSMDLFDILIDMLYHDIVSREMLDKQIEFLNEKFDKEIIEDHILPNSFFTGIQNMDGETLADLYISMMDDIYDGDELEKSIESFREKVGDAPVADMLHLLCLKKKKEKEYDRKIEEYYQKHPDYFVIQVLHIYHSHESPEVIKEKLEALFQSKQAITRHESEIFFTNYATALSEEFLSSDNDTIGELSTLLAFEKYDLFIYDVFIRNFLTLVKMKKVYDYSARAYN